MSAKDFNYEEDLNQGLGAIHNPCFPVCSTPLFCSFGFLKQHNTELSVSLYSDPETGVCDGANCWPCDVVNLQYSVPKLIVLPMSLYQTDCSLYSSPFPQWHSGHDVHYIVRFELSTSILYHFFYRLFQPAFFRACCCCFFSTFHVFWHFVRI